VVGNTDGQIYAHGDLGPVTILGNVIGHGNNTGRIAADGKLSTVKIGGDLRGGEVDMAGTIQSGVTAALGQAGAGSITIGGNVVSNATHTGGIFINGPTPSVTIGGSILGSAGDMNVNEDINGNLSVNGTVGIVKVGRDIVGSTGNESGYIFAGKIGSLTIGGALRGGTASLSGAVSAVTVGPVKIGGDLEGFANSTRNGGIQADTIGSVTIGGSIKSGHLQAVTSIGAVVVKGGIVGTAAQLVTIQVSGGTSQVAKSSLASLTVGAGVERAKILIGTSVSFASADSQIGAVKVGGAWIASDLIAGVKDVNADGFGNADDVKQPTGGADNPAILSRIASITIGGPVVGTSGVSGDRFAFEAQSIGAFKLGGEAFVLRAGGGNDNFNIGVTGDVRLREVPVP
jgi:hypothetical protein